ncbi:HEPN domain-containing protein [Candidatus Woesearchaeota archaeon]|nr:HEPN domain-containing protein [Candidatus Woesearchaeota archaeon]
MAKQYMDRAENELRLSAALKIISESLEEKKGLGLNKDDTFYSSVISHAYYAIFYSAKAILLTRGIKTNSPEVHKGTLEAFKEHFVDLGILDVELLRIYNKMIVRADELLGLFQAEKRKRGQFVYKTIPQANIEPTIESIDNAKKFVKHIKQIIEKI